MRSLHPQRLNLLVHADLSDIARHKDESCQVQPLAQPYHPSEDWPGSCRGHQQQGHDRDLPHCSCSWLGTTSDPAYRSHEIPGEQTERINAALGPA